MTGEQIQRARGAAGVGLRELARRLNISASHLCDIEHARRVPAHHLALKIAATLGLPPPDAASAMMRTGKLPRQPTPSEAVEIAHVLGMAGPGGELE